MDKERRHLRSAKAAHKTKLKELKDFVRELNERCSECSTLSEHVWPDLMKAEHDLKFHEGQINAINQRLRRSSTGNGG